MVKIGKKPIIWHIIKHYQFYGFKNFIICGGYKYKIIQNYFLKNKEFKNEKINIFNTGAKSLTATRIRKIKNILPENFCLTYGDAVSNIDLNKLINFHFKKSILIITGVVPTSKYGSIKFSKIKNLKFMKKRFYKRLC